MQNDHDILNQESLAQLNMASDPTPGAKRRGFLRNNGALARFLVPFLLGCAFTTFLFGLTGLSSIPASHHVLPTSLWEGPSSPRCEIFFSTYRGQEYTTPSGGTVGSPKCLVESKFLKVQQHSVRFPGSDQVITDWLWIDYHDRINVLVEAPSDMWKKDSQQQSERHFLVFEQTKYALEGRSTLAIIGGLVEPGETPPQSAQREVQEEMRMECRQWHFLGRFRTDVNRGVGWLNSFVATDCSKSRSLENANKEQVGGADTERQALQVISLSNLRKAVEDGRFLEVQWTTTLSLALLHLQH